MSGMDEILKQANEMQKPITENWIEGYKKWKSKK